MNFKSHFLPIAMLVMLLAVSSTITPKVFGQDDYNNDYNNNDYSQNDGNYQNGNNYQDDEEPMIQPDQDVTFDQFYNDLTPYGRWVDYPSYGRVWICNVSGFRPYYSGGHWAYTHFGWTWVSDYNWGWAPFHYGRWSFDAAYGWFWVPGYTWGPAWVSWRHGGDYYGWAPLSPGINISVGVGWGSGIAAANWVFMPNRYMGYRNIGSYYVRPQRNVTIIRNTTIINNTNVYNNNRYIVGPQRQEVERYTGRQIQPQNIYVSNRENVQRQDNRGIHIYRPQPRGGNTVINNRNVVRNNVQNNNVIQNNNNAQQPGNRNNLPSRTWHSPAQQPNRANDNAINNNNQAQPNYSNRQMRQMERNQQGMNNRQNNNLQQQNAQQQQRLQDMQQQRRQQMQNNQQNAQQQQQDVNRRQQMMQQQQQQDRYQQQLEQQRQQQQQRQQEMMQRRDQMQQMQERQQRQNQEMQQRQQQMQQMQQQRQQQMNQMRQQQMQNRNSGGSFSQGGGRQFQPQQQHGASRRSRF